MTVRWCLISKVFVLNWTFPFAPGVVKGYKLSIPYCHAVLRHQERIGPDGEPVAGSTVVEIPGLPPITVPVLGPPPPAPPPPP